jgi:hypothetical protein
MGEQFIRWVDTGKEVWKGTPDDQQCDHHHQWAYSSVISQGVSYRTAIIRVILRDE